MGYGNEGQLRLDIVRMAKAMHVSGLISAYDGNLSVRLGRGRFLMTPSGGNKALLDAADLVVVDQAGRTLRGRGHPSSEYRVHLAAYAARSDVGAVVRAHPPHCIACTLAGIRLDQLVLPETAFLLGAVPTIPYQTPGTDEFSEAVAPLLPLHHAFLLERHGALTLGTDLSEAYNRLESLEHTARVLSLARNLGEIRPMAPNQVARLRREVEGRGIPWPYVHETAQEVSPASDLVDALAQRVMESLRRT